jgi:sRNA-binding carbon storage regulator CsrA
VLHLDRYAGESLVIGDGRSSVKVDVRGTHGHKATLLVRLGRFPGQDLVFEVAGQRVRIVVDDVDHGRVKLGIDAPREIHIRRSELEPLAEDDDATPEPSLL